VYIKFYKLDIFQNRYRSYSKNLFDTIKKINSYLFLFQIGATNMDLGGNDLGNDIDFSVRKIDVVSQVHIRRLDLMTFHQKKVKKNIKAQ